MWAGVAKSPQPPRGGPAALRPGGRFRCVDAAAPRVEAPRSDEGAPWRASTGVCSVEADRGASVGRLRTAPPAAGAAGPPRGGCRSSLVSMSALWSVTPCPATASTIAARRVEDGGKSGIRDETSSGMKGSGNGFAPSVPRRAWSRGGLDEPRREHTGRRRAEPDTERLEQDMACGI